MIYDFENAFGLLLASYFLLSRYTLYVSDDHFVSFPTSLDVQLALATFHCSSYHFWASQTRVETITMARPWHISMSDYSSPFFVKHLLLRDVGLCSSVLPWPALIKFVYISNYLFFSDPKSLLLPYNQSQFSAPAKPRSCFLFFYTS